MAAAPGPQAVNAAARQRLPRDYDTMDMRFPLLVVHEGSEWMERGSLVEVLDACGLNDRFWVFTAGTTNVEWTLRVVDTRTGRSEKVWHTETHGTCQEVCVGDSCMLYVPYKQRYGDGRADCLR